MSEIIEIGLCVVDVAALERVERRSILVRPACSAVCAYCTQLTTLTQADVHASIRLAGGIPLAEACRVLADEYKSRERLFASFGDHDVRDEVAWQFERNCAAFGIAYPFSPTHLNVKNLAAVAYGWSREVGMSEALKRLAAAAARLPLEGTHHRGGDDAWNPVLSEVEGIAGLLCHLLRSIRGRRDHDQTRPTTTQDHADRSRGVHSLPAASLRRTRGLVA